MKPRSLSTVRRKQHDQRRKNQQGNKSSRVFARGFSDIHSLAGTSRETGKKWGSEELLQAEGARRHKLKKKKKKPAIAKSPLRMNHE